MSSDKHDSWTAVRHYVALSGYAFRTGDAGPLKELSDPKCVSCKGMIEQVEDVYGAGGRFEGGVEGRIEGISGSDKLVILNVEYGEVKVIPERGAKAESYEAARKLETYTMKREGERWIVREIDSNEPAK